MNEKRFEIRMVLDRELSDVPAHIRIFIIALVNLIQLSGGELVIVQESERLEHQIFFKRSRDLEKPTPEKTAKKPIEGIPFPKKRTIPEGFKPRKIVLKDLVEKVHELNSELYKERGIRGQDISQRIEQELKKSEFVTNGESLYLSEESVQTLLEILVSEWNINYYPLRRVGKVSTHFLIEALIDLCAEHEGNDLDQ